MSLCGNGVVVYVNTEVLVLKNLNAWTEAGLHANNVMHVGHIMTTMFCSLQTGLTKMTIVKIFDIFIKFLQSKSSNFIVITYSRIKL